MTSGTPRLGVLTGVKAEARCIFTVPDPDSVIPGLDPGIHASMRASESPERGVDGRVKPGHDEDGLPAIVSNHAITYTVALSGARLAGARAGAARLAAHATHLLSFGLAGGLDPALVPGQLLLPQTVLGPDGTDYPVDRAWHGRATELLGDFSPRTAPLAGSDSAVASPAAKAALFARTGAAAVDMESHVLAAEAARHGLPFLVLRVVCDPAAAGLPPAALVAVRADGGTDLRALLAALVRRPGQLPALVRLGRHARAAERTLLRCCGRGIVRLVVG